MPKQVFNLTNNVSSIEIKKNGTILYEIPLSKKTIDLNALYNNMQVQIDDEFEFDVNTAKVPVPKTDLERIYNNVYDFLNNLFVGLNKKLVELKMRNDTSVFK